MAAEAADEWAVQAHRSQPAVPHCRSVITLQIVLLMNQSFGLFNYSTPRCTPLCPRYWSLVGI